MPGSVPSGGDTPTASATTASARLPSIAGRCCRGCAAGGAAVTCNLSCQGDPTRLDSPRASHLYYIAREAFHNAQRHAAATRVDLHLTIQDHAAELVVADDGAGIDLSVPNLPGMGLSIMSNRAELIGGRFEIDTAPQRGTRITCLVPFQPISPV